MRRPRPPQAIALLCALGVALVVVPAGAPRSAETLHVSSGAPVTTSSPYVPDSEVRITGTVTETLNGKVMKFDAFNCYEGCGTSTSQSVLLMAAEKYASQGPNQLSFWSFGSDMAYDPSHTYTTTLRYGDEGRLTFSISKDAGATYSGSFTVQVLGPEPGAACGSGTLKCKLDRVQYLQGTTHFVSAAENREAVAGELVYFRAAVNGQKLPAQLVLLFPKEVGKDGISVERKTGVDCGDGARYSDARSQWYLLCKLESTQTSGVIARVQVPGALAGQKLDVVMAVVTKKPSDSSTQVLAKATTGVDVKVDVPTPRPAPPSGPKDLIEGHWVGSPAAVNGAPAAFPDADITIGPAQKEGLWIGRGSGLEIFLNRPRDESRMYEGTASTGGQDQPFEAQLITSTTDVAFPYCEKLRPPAGGVVLCGWWRKPVECFG